MNKNKNIVFNIKVLLYFTIIFIGIFTILNSYSFFIMSDNQRKLTNQTLPTIYEMNELKNNTGNIEKYIRESILTRKAFILERLQANVKQSILDTKNILKNKNMDQFKDISTQIDDIENITNKFFLLKKDYINLLRKRDNYLEDIYIIRQNISKKSNLDTYNKMFFLLVSAIHANNYKKIKNFRKEFLDIKRKTKIDINKHATKELNFDNMFDNQMKIIRLEYKLNKTILRFVQLESLNLKVKNITEDLLSKEQSKAKEFDNKLYELVIYLVVAFIISLIIFILFVNYVKKISNRMLELKNGMSSYVEGDEVQIETTNNDEIGIIGKNFMHFVHKVSQREQELEKAKQKAEEATKSKSLFLANMSHEIRTPMNAIISMAYFISQTKLSKEQTELVTKIESASNNLLGIINDILDFSKVEAGKLEIDRIDFSINELLNNVSNIVELKAVEQGLHYEVSIDTQYDILFGDPLRIQQILINLINNAIKFTKRGSIEIQIEQKNNEIIRFNVKDTGIGINKEQLNKLFKSFSQADESTTRKYGGTGLGLTISKQLVELMDGKIGVDSKEGFGSLFYFEIKLPKGNKNKIESKGLQKDIDDLKSEITKLRDSNILLVEDNEINREIINRFLSFSGINIDEAYNGKIAVEMYESNPNKYDLILMDIQMPVMDGLEATKKIREINTNTPIIALTASVLKQDLEKTKEAGMVEHLNKPVKVEEFFDTLLKFITIKHTNATNIEQNNIVKKSTPILKSIDTKIGLSYLMNDKTIYDKVLLDFYNKYKELNIDSLDEKELRILIHTINGLSANIGAMELNKIVQNYYDTKDKKLLELFEEELSKVLKEINIILER